VKAMQVFETSGGLGLREAEMAQPKVGRGQVLVRVRAAGVTKAELNWYPTTHQKNGEARVGAVPGHEFSGVVAEVGDGVTAFAAGDAVYGMNDWFGDGATAEFCVTQATYLAGKPGTLSYEEAASGPIGALTAWQGLFDRAKLKAGEGVLVQVVRVQ
jgi:NADPH:quinone reductase-like Zn-dependent oxidoreductase